MTGDTTPISPLLDAADLDRLRTALDAYTVDSTDDLLGPVGRAAHGRGDLAGVARVVAASPPSPLSTLVSLFLLGATVPLADVREAMHPLPVEAAVAAGLVDVSVDEARARLEIRPYAEAGSEQRWWVVSDLGSDVRPGPLAHDHVLGIGNAALTLAQATPRAPVARALDIGTGCGVQALHLAGHAEHVVGTDISRRALRFAATGAALSGQRWELRQGSFVEPVAGETFDLVVANPPFVISPGGVDGAPEYDYRDSGSAGDDVCRDLVRAIPSVLAPGGTGQLLANWIIPVDGAWQERVGRWFDGSGCDAWVWQREVAEIGEYVTMWLRDAGLAPGTPEWARRYDAWLDWFADNGVAAVGMGLITMIARGPGEPTGTVLEDVPQAHAQPIGDEIIAWFDRRRRLTGTDDDALLTARYRPAADLVRSRHDLLDDLGWSTRRDSLRQSHGMRWEVEVDDAVAGLVAACDVGATPMTALDVLAATSGDDPAELAAAFAPVLRDLVQRGFLLPEDGR